MSNSSPSQNGKGSARRHENQSKIRDNWDSIDWSKGRPATKPKEASVEEVLLADHVAKNPWTIPSNEEMRAALFEVLEATTDRDSERPKCSCGQPGEEDHTCPYAEEINGSDALCNCCSDCQYECCMAI